MKKLALLIAGWLCYGTAFPQVSILPGQLDGTHDIRLSPWGPYSKKYAGISHIPEMQSGIRFDFSVMPGFYRNKMLVPNVLFESGYYPWDINKDQTRITYRYELEWKDRVYVDVTYHVIDSSAVLVAAKCVNNTTLPQNLNLNMMAYIDYPDVYPAEKVRQGIWFNAADYRSLDFSTVRPQDNLVHLGYKRGEVRGNDYLDGSCIAQRFAKVTYAVTVKDDQRKGNIRLRYRLKKDAQCSFRISGLSKDVVTFKGTGEFEEADVPYTFSKPGEHLFTLTSNDNEAPELNGFFLIPEGTPQPEIIANPKRFEPVRSADIASRKMLLKYDDIPAFYGLAWEEKQAELRQVKNDELDIYFRKLVHNHTSAVFNGNNNGHYTNLFIRPIELAPQSDRTIYALLSTGNKEQVSSKLDAFADIRTAVQKQAHPEPYADILPEGKPFVFSQQLLRATLLSNIVYPIYTQRSYIRHFNPGKWWNILYTWDAGFIALGLKEVNLMRAVECINAYTTSPGNQSAFIHHGSPVPVQMYAFFDLWNSTGSDELLRYFYPRLKQYYEFLAGRSGSSTTRTQAGLIKTWDYFYNSGGWDDYPAQVAVHRQKLTKTVAPVSNTAHCIRVAKMLRMAADALHKKDDVKAYDGDIQLFSAALQKYAWNPSSGYFSYVVHDEQGGASGQFKNAEQTDMNMGLDGAYPLFAGICTPEQEDTLLQKIFSEKHMWTPSGICVVDQSAPYYRMDGYWNGAVWMPHQWFMWKCMLDIGRTDLAKKIAQKGLEVYSKEADASYYTFEHFFAKTGRGAGWHQFGGLSTPVLSWFAAYYKPGTVTAGFETRIKQRSFDAPFTSMDATLTFDKATAPHIRSLLVCMSPASAYKVTFNGKEIAAAMPYSGLLEITLPATNKDGRLLISPIEKR